MAETWIRSKIWCGGCRTIVNLPEQAQRLFFRGGDLAARFWLNERTMSEFDAKNFDGASMLLHAERYLADRLAYELAPWPKGMMKVETEDDYRLPDRAQTGG